MKKHITVKFDKELQDYYFDIQDLANILDITLVDSYELESTEDGKLVLAFYDKNGTPVIPKVQK